MNHRYVRSRPTEIVKQVEKLLVVSTLTSIQTKRRHQGAVSQERIDTIHTKLDEIHQWFTANLQANNSDTSRKAQAETSPQPPLPSQERQLLHTFSISEVSTQSINRRLVCPNASFYGHWLSNSEDNTSRSIFQCHCHSNTSSEFRQSPHPLPYHGK